MADETILPVGFEGGLADEVPKSTISRRAEGAALAFGVPVKQGTGDDDCVAGIAVGDFLGITVAQSDRGRFEENEHARILAQGCIWVKVAGTVAAGQPVTYDSGWKTAADGAVTLAEARYETGADSGQLAKVRLWGTNVVSNAG